MGIKASQQSVESYLGSVTDCYAGYAVDDNIRDGATSGGFVSSFLLYLLKQGIIDGAIVSREYVKNGRIMAESYFAEDERGILESRSSIYMDFPFFGPLYELKHRNIRVAIVGLPCHLRTVNLMEEKYDWLRGKIVCKIGLFCSHSSSSQLIHKVLQRERIDLANVETFCFRTGHWRGNLVFRMKDGSTNIVPYLRFGLYMNLYFFEKHRCLSCTDHTAETSDISCGDNWQKELKDHPVKHSTVLLRNENAVRLFRAFDDASLFTCKRMNPTLLLSFQKRGLIRKKHYVSAFRSLSRFFGYNVSYDGPRTARWNHYIGAFLLMLNMKASENERLMNIAFRLPRRLWYPYVAMVKFFMSF